VVYTVVKSVTVEGPGTELLLTGATGVDEAGVLDTTAVEVAGIVEYSVDVSVRTVVDELMIVEDVPDVLTTDVIGQIEVVV
jgi:hypothetical protein